MTISIAICNELELIDKLVFRACGFEMTSRKAESESQEYFAQTFQLAGRNVKFRTAKITPTKTGQFVTIWKRNVNGITEPFSIEDNFDFYVIATRMHERLGVFIFPKLLLHEKGVLSDKTNDGKRGIRVYSPWDVTTSKQAQNTQQWQTKYFIEISRGADVDLERAKDLLTGLH